MCVVGSWNESRKTKNLFSRLTLSRDFWNCLSAFYAHWVPAKYQNNARYIWGAWKINEAPPLHGCVPFLFYPQEYAAAKLCLQTVRAVTCKRCFFQKLPLFKMFDSTFFLVPLLYCQTYTSAFACFGKIEVILHWSRDTVLYSGIPQDQSSVT